MTMTITLYSLGLLIALSALIPFTQARYLWHPNEQPQAFDYNFSPPLKGEHHILNFAAAPEPASQSSETLTRTEGISTKKDHSSTAIAVIQPTLIAPKPSSNKSPLAKETKLVTHSASTKPNGPSALSVVSTATPTTTPTSSDPTSLLPSTSITSTSSNDTNGTSSGGAVAGIVIAVIALLGAITAFVMIRKKKQTKRDLSPDPFTMGFGSHDPPMTAYPTHDPPTTVYSTHDVPTTYHASPTTTTYSPHDPAPTITYPNNPYQIPPVTQPYYQDPAYMSSLPPPQQGSLGIFNVVSTYAPTLSDEIDIQMGDQIELLVEYDDGWCQGMNLTRGHAKGVFPRHCIETGPQLGHMNRVSSMYLTH